jgi:hypothetical protein
VPSGVWSVEDYLKLPPYDGETWEQLPTHLRCHATPDFLCHGWVVVGGWDLLGLRLLLSLHPDEDFEMPTQTVPLFETHTAAARHGVEDIHHPSKEAKHTMERLLRKYERLRDE